MARYSVTFKSRAIANDDVASFLSVDKKNVCDACEALMKPNPPAGEIVLTFPELGVASLELDDNQAKRLTKSTDVEQLLPVRTVSTRSISAPTPFHALESREDDAEVSWNIQLVRANEVWDRTTGMGVRVGIMDSGISRSHPDLHVVGGASFVPGIPDWDDVDDGHGTMCAGIVGARRNSAGVVGVAPGCDLYALKVSRQGQANTDWILAAMVWAAREGLDIVSHSMWNDDGASTPDEEPWLDVGRGAELLMASGCLVVGIAGNSGSFPNPWVTNPARADSIIAVGSVDRNSDWSSFSSFGPPELRPLQGVELVAPGAQIRSTYLGGGYATGNGTSFACPHVSGAGALLKYLHPSWSPHELRLRLHQTATDLPSTGMDVKTGWGLLNCLRAVTDPGIPGHVYNQLSGTVASVSREGRANVIKFRGSVTLRDWASGGTVDDPVFVLSPPAVETDIALLASAIGRRLTVFGLILDDASDPKRFRTDQLASIEVG